MTNRERLDALGYKSGDFDTDVRKALEDLEMEFPTSLRGPFLVEVVPNDPRAADWLARYGVGVGPAVNKKEK